jgi:hypothetical protein
MWCLAGYCPSRVTYVFILGGRFSIEALLRLRLGVADAAPLCLSFYLLYEASRLGVRRLLLGRMLATPFSKV